MSYAIAPEVFFLVENGKVLLWNCTTHEQYLINQHYFEKILFISKSGELTSDRICNDLINAGVIVTKQTSSQHQWGWDILSRLFHSGTKNVLYNQNIENVQSYAQNYLVECEQIKHAIPSFFQEKNTTLIELPEPNLDFEDAKFATVIKKRKTSRSFYSQSVTVQQLSNLLYAGFGLIHGEWQELSEQGLQIAGLRKSSPSSGGLHAEEAYITAFHIDGLEPGLYYYRPQDHKLNVLKLGNYEDKIIQLNKNQFYSKGMAFGIYITARLDKYWWKYEHSRSYRIMLLDIGHVSQTFLLSATAAGLNTWMTGAFNDSEIEQFLGINGYNESVILYVGAGYGNSLVFPETFHASIDTKK
ncbi:MAG: SagB/ThcOx family dehydrogenase [Legionellales bacterium]|nr:SagB/ThcOx family dehydrogenase [Legionellales bacterium]